MRLSFIKRFATFSPVLLSALPALGAPQEISTLGRRATVCNGHAELCDRSFGTVAFVGAHDSYAIGPSDNLAVNQDQRITTQLNNGIRMLQMQAHRQDGAIRLCHTNCALFDGGLLNDYLQLVKEWLDANPNEVLSLLIVNIDNIPVSQYDGVFKGVGLDAISFVPQTASLPATSWPTLGSMIDSQKRLVTFMDNAADASVPYIIDEFSNVWETAFNVVELPFNCSIDRGNAQVDPAGQMFLINHFLDKLVFNNPVPDIASLDKTNAASGSGSLGEHVDTCRREQGRPPNFLLVDFYEYGGGSVFDVAADINGVPRPTDPVATPSAIGSTASSTGSSTSRPLDNGATLMHGLISPIVIFSALSTIVVTVLGPRLFL